MSDYFELLEKEDEYKEILIEIGTGTLAVGGALAGRYAAGKLGKKMGVSKKTQKKMNKWGYVAGAGSAIGAKKAHQAIQQRKMDKMVMSDDDFKYEQSIFEDTFAKITARATGGFAGKAKKAAIAAKTAAERLKAWEATRDRWNREAKNK